MVAGFELEAVPCPLCDSLDVTEPVWLRDVALGVPGVFALARCKACGLWQQNPRVPVHRLASIYPDHYPRHVGDPELPRLVRNGGDVVRWTLASRLGYTHLAGHDVSLAVRLIAPWTIRRITEIFPPWTGRGRLLDVGCATGRYLKLMASVGWDVAGIELDAAAAAKARTVTPAIFEGDPLDASFAPASFDVITSFHVVEHLPRPREALRRMLEWLAPGGLMIVEVPNIGGVGGRLFGRYWSGLDFPRHLTHFAPATMHALVRRAGGRIVGIRHRTKPRWLVWSLRQWLRDQPAPLARPALAALNSRTGGGLLKLALEVVLPLARRAGLGEMTQYMIRRGDDAAGRQFD